MARFSPQFVKLKRFCSLSIYIRINKYSTDPAKETFVSKRKLKKEAKALSDVIVSTNQTLRNDSLNKKDEEVRQLWLKHTKNTEHLQEYAKSMHNLATRYWALKDIGDNVSRISWTYDALKEYFFGGLHAVKLEREKRRVSLQEPTSLEDFLHKASEAIKRYESVDKLKVLDVGSCYNPFGKYNDLEVTPIDLHPAIPEVHRCDFLRLKVTDGEEVKNINEENSCDSKFSNQGLEKPPLNTRNHLLDIENHNDNKRISENNGEDTAEERIKLHDKLESESKNFDVFFKTEVDNSSVEKISEENRLLSENNTEKLPVNNNDVGITELKGNVYDAVIFCFVLDYIPTPSLRYDCCLKAFKLLKSNGILCLITPDCKQRSVTKTHVFKLWKGVLGLVGFERIRYEKCSHFHGMVFRKSLAPSTLKDRSEKELKLLQSKRFFDRYPNFDWSSFHNSLYILPDFVLTEEEKNCKE